VRVPAHEYRYVAGALDAGAQGLMIPMTESAYFGEADHRFRSKPTTRFGLMATTYFTDGDHPSARVRWVSVSDLWE